MATDMKINGIAPWYGSKRTLADRIIQQLGPHSCYWEPFCGSLAILLAKPRCTMETVCDLHSDLVNMARIIQHSTEGPRLYRRLRRVRFAKELFDQEARAVIENEPAGPGIDRALWFFVYSWFGRNGVIGSCGGVNFCVRYTSNGGQPATRWEAAVASIPAWNRRLRGVTILSTCGLEACERVEDKPGTIIYVDPPYLAKGERYVHDFEAADHIRLATALCRFQHTRVVVSYYQHDDLAKLYPGWQIVRCNVTKAMVNMGQRGRTGEAAKAPEVLLVNGDLYGEQERDGLF